MKVREVIVSDRMQSQYFYFRTEPPGKNFHPEFRPQLTPKQMLQLGVFGGKYMTDCTGEFPEDWFEHAKLCPERHNPALNFFGVNASLPLSEWRRKGWIYFEDPRGWFQWYCRYWTQNSRRRTPDPPLENDGASLRTTPELSSPRRLELSAPSAPGSPALGLRHSESLTEPLAFSPRHSPGKKLFRHFFRKLLKYYYIVIYYIKQKKEFRKCSGKSDC